MHRPLFIPGTGTAVVFIHGYMGSPSQLNYLIKAATDQGFAAQALLLPGHGGTVADFSRGTSSAWQAHVDEAVSSLRREYPSVYLAGHSMGGLLALNHAARYPVQGLFLIACPFRLKRFGLQPAKIRLMQLFYPSSHPMKSAYLSASSVPISPSLLWRSSGPSSELRRLMAATEKLLPHVSAPVTAIYSEGDELVSPSSLDVLRSGLTASALQVVTLEESCHAYYPESDKLLITRALLDMLAQ